MTANIVEIFKSIQGEGKYIGAAQVFVRFGGCNLKCGWCDTPQASAVENSRQREIDGVVQEVMSLTEGCHSVTLTGGEPLLQWQAAGEIAKLLKAQGLKIFLETNGVLTNELLRIIDSIDIISMDFKLPDSANGQNFSKDHEDFLKIASDRDVYVKAVVSLETEADDVLKAAEMIKGIRPDIMLVLQPNAKQLGKKLMEKCSCLQLKCSSLLENVRLIPQMHKLAGIR